MIHALGWGLAAALALMVGVWLLSLARRDASIVDVFWGPGFVVLGWLYFLLASPADRRVWIPALVTLWGLRLAAHIFWRNRGQGEDYRYRAMREHHGAAFPWISLFTVFGVQGLVMWVVGLPLAAAQAGGDQRATAWLAAAGVALFATGFAFETIGDLQLARFKAVPGNRGKVMDRGLWRYTRHPNYFGDAVVWWGLWLAGSAAVGTWWTAIGPLLMHFLLLRVSGVALLERKLRETRPAYREYVERTNAFLPWFPRPRGQD